MILLILGHIVKHLNCLLQYMYMQKMKFGWTLFRVLVVLGPTIFFIHILNDNFAILPEVHFHYQPDQRGEALWPSSPSRLI